MSPKGAAMRRGGIESAYLAACKLGDESLDERRTVDAPERDYHRVTKQRCRWKPDVSFPQSLLPLLSPEGSCLRFARASWLPLVDIMHVVDRACPAGARQRQMLGLGYEAPRLATESVTVMASRLVPGLCHESQSDLTDAEVRVAGPERHMAFGWPCMAYYAGSSPARGPGVCGTQPREALESVWAGSSSGSTPARDTARSMGKQPPSHETFG